MIRVEHVLDSWRADREETAAAVEEFPAAEFDFQPTPELDSFRKIARHALDAGDGLSGALLAGVEDFHSRENHPKIKEHFQPLAADCTPRELAAALRASIERIATGFEGKPAPFFEHLVTHMDGRKMTRLEFVQWTKEHELTHRQQLFMYMRLKGLTPATTRKRKERLAAREVAK